MLNVYNTYRSEIQNLGNLNDDYFTLMHINMNADNTWFWRDEERKLDLGVLDWGGLAKDNIPRKLWWSYYGAECHMLEDHLDGLLQLFVDTFQQEGGPKLDVGIVRKGFLVAALDQGLMVLAAVPSIYRVIKKDAWPSV